MIVKGLRSKVSKELKIVQKAENSNKFMADIV